MKPFSKRKQIRFLGSPLARRQLVGILLFSSLITLVGSSLQIYTEYRQDRTAIDHQLDLIERIHLESLTIGLWQLDNASVQLQLNNILQLGDIVRLEILEDGRLVFSAGPGTPGMQTVSKTYPMRFSNAGDQEEIGALIAYASLDNVYERLVQRTFVILATQGLKTFLVSLFILFLIYRLVIQHLLQISAYMQRLRIGALDKELAIDRRPTSASTADEIEQLVEAINAMRERLSKDLQRRRQAEADLRLSEEKYRTLVETLPLGVQLTDRQGRILFANPTLHRMLEQPPGSLIGRHLWDTQADPGDQRRVRAHHRALVGEQPHPTVYEDTIVTPSGRQMHTQINWAYVRGEDGDVQRILRVISDISGRKQLEDELLQARKMESLGTLTGGIAHDFNNILSVIMGNNELAMDNPTDNEVVGECLEQIHFAALRAKDIVAQLLSYSRKAQLEKQPTLAATLIADTLTLLRPLIPATIAVEAQIDLEGECLLAAPTQIQMALMNICINGSQAMQERGGTLRLAAAVHHLEAADMADHPGLAPGRHVAITIEDDGPGIPPEVLDRIFDPYFTTKAVGKGSGMGLAVVHGIVQSHNGTIMVESAAGKGTCFRLLLPLTDLKPVPDEETHPVALPRGEEKILFVDDEAGIVAMAEQMLSRLGYRVEGCTHPEEALARLRADGQRCDLLITDMAMPAMSGDQLASAVRQMLPRLPIILSTGYSSKLDTDATAATWGVQALIAKPFDMEKLARVVRRTLDTPGA